MAESRPSAKLRKAVEERARGCCEYCRAPARFAPDPLSVEHISPRGRGGETSLENLAFACQGCNNHKFTKTQYPDPVSGNNVELFHPRRMHWGEHFSWSAEYTEIIGLTPVGRATIIALRLNRPGLVNLRRVLFAVGVHPG